MIIIVSKQKFCYGDMEKGYTFKLLVDKLGKGRGKMPIPSIFGDTEPLPPEAIILPNNTYATRGDNRDKGQREFCGCMKSKDIGEYNTCVHLCEYCYANTSKEAVQRNYNSHQANSFSEIITGN